MPSGIIFCLIPETLILLFAQKFSLVDANLYLSKLNKNQFCNWEISITCFNMR